MQQVEGILLDIDGTLIDSNEAHARSWLAALKASGFKLTYESIREKIGMAGDNILPLVAKIQSTSPQGEKIENLRSEIFHNVHLKNIKPFPYAQQLLEELQSLKYKIVAASSTNPADLSALLKQTGLHGLIDESTSSSDARKSKTRTDFVEMALKKINLPASHVVMIGDTPYDIAAASQAGIATIAFTCGGWGPDDMKDAVRFFEDPEEMLADLKKYKHQVLQIPKSRRSEAQY